MAKPHLISDDEFREAAKTGETQEAQLRKAFIAEVKTVDGGDRRLDFTISTDTVDRMGDTIAVDGWQLANYRKNPVVLWAHDSSMPPIAKALNIRIEDGKLKASADFVPADIPVIGPMAECTLQLLRSGFLSAVSVGFAPVKYAFSDAPGRSFGVDFLEQELLEFSVCPVPANPEALVEARSAGINMVPLRDWATKLLACENLVLIDTTRLAAVNALAEEFRSDAKKASGAKGASGIYRRCANRIDRALNGEEPAADPLDTETEPASNHADTSIEPALPNEQTDQRDSAEEDLAKFTEVARIRLELAKRRFARP